MFLKLENAQIFIFASICFVIVMFPVNKCPERLTEVKEASKRIGCGRDKFNNDQYMCIPNEEKTSLVEFCYDGIMGIKEEGLYKFNDFII